MKIQLTDHLMNTMLRRAGVCGFILFVLLFFFIFCHWVVLEFCVVLVGIGLFAIVLCLVLLQWKTEDSRKHLKESVVRSFYRYRDIVDSSQMDN